MLARLGRGPLSASALGAGFPISQPAVSKHLRRLREAGLVRAAREGRRRVYQLDPAGVAAVRRWYRQTEWLWNEALERYRRHVEGSR